MTRSSQSATNLQAIVVGWVKLNANLACNFEVRASHCGREQPLTSPLVRCGLLASDPRFCANQLIFPLGCTGYLDGSHRRARWRTSRGPGYMWQARRNGAWVHRPPHLACHPGPPTEEKRHFPQQVVDPRRRVFINPFAPAWPLGPKGAYLALYEALSSERRGERIQPTLVV